MLCLEMEPEFLFCIIPEFPGAVNRYPDCNPANMPGWA